MIAFHLHTYISYGLRPALLPLQLQYLFLDLPNCLLHLRPAVQSAPHHHYPNRQQQQYNRHQDCQVVCCVHLHQARVQVQRDVVRADRLQLFPIPVRHTAARVEFHQDVHPWLLTTPFQPALHLGRLFLDHEQGQEACSQAEGVGVAKVGPGGQGMYVLDSQGSDAGGAVGVVAFEECLSVDGVGHHQQFVVSTDDQFGVVVTSKAEQQTGVIDFIVVAIEFECLIGSGKALVEIELGHIVVASLLADHVEGGLVLVEVGALLRLQLNVVCLVLAVLGGPESHQFVLRQGPVFVVVGNGVSEEGTIRRGQVSYQLCTTILLGEFVAVDGLAPDCHHQPEVLILVVVAKLKGDEFVISQLVVTSLGASAYFYIPMVVKVFRVNCDHLDTVIEYNGQADHKQLDINLFRRIEAQFLEGYVDLLFIESSAVERVPPQGATHVLLQV